MNVPDMMQSENMDDCKQYIKSKRALLTKIRSYMTLMINIPSYFCIQRHPGHVFIPEFLVWYSVELKSTLDEVCHLDKVTFNTISLKWKYLAQIHREAQIGPLRRFLG